MGKSGVLVVCHGAFAMVVRHGAFAMEAY